MFAKTVLRATRKVLLLSSSHIRALAVVATETAVLKTVQLIQFRNVNVIKCIDRHDITVE